MITPIIYCINLSMPMSSYGDIRVSMPTSPIGDISEHTLLVLNSNITKTTDLILINYIPF